MPISTVRELVMYHEGFRARVYDDATGHLLTTGAKVQGHPTIGYGRALDVRGITRAEADLLLQHDLEHARTAAEKYAWFRVLNAPRQAVVVDMIFNLGEAGFWEFRKTIAALSRGDYGAASVEMLDSLWAEQVGARATHLAGMMLTGTWEGSTGG